MRKLFFLLVISLITQTLYAFEITNKNINDLKFGKTNPTIKQLQIFLNENGFYESEEGPGSPDNETEYFGNTTVAAVKIFQEYSELPITGKVDFKTGRSINEYIKEIKNQESSYEEITLFAEKDYFKNADSVEDIYKTDSVDSYAKTTINTYTANPEKKSLKDLLEKTTFVSAEKPKAKTIFQRFISIFE